MFLPVRELFTAGSLKPLDLLLGHVVGNLLVPQGNVGFTIYNNKKRV